jgi:hypothetical protein
MKKTPRKKSLYNHAHRPRKPRQTKFSGANFGHRSQSQASKNNITPIMEYKTDIKDLKTLKAMLKKKVQSKKGKALISSKFTQDHVFPGHCDSVEKLALHLAKLRSDKPASTKMIGSLDPTAQEEVLNWLARASDAWFEFDAKKSTWSVKNTGTTVQSCKVYKFATVDLKAYKELNGDDKIKKARKWLTISQKSVKIACQLSADGLLQIYHMDY